jgi:hypothetical protein
MIRENKEEEEDREIGITLLLIGETPHFNSH